MQNQITFAQYHNMCTREDNAIITPEDERIEAKSRSRRIALLKKQYEAVVSNGEAPKLSILDQLIEIKD